MMENVSPLLNCSNVIVHSLTSCNSIWEHPNYLSDILNTCDEFEVLKIIECCLNLMNKAITSIKAVLKLNEMVMTSESINKASSKVWNSVYRWQKDMIMMVKALNWSKKVYKSSSGVITSIEPVSRCPI